MTESHSIYMHTESLHCQTNHSVESVETRMLQASIILNRTSTIFTDSLSNFSDSIPKYSKNTEFENRICSPMLADSEE